MGRFYKKAIVTALLVSALSTTAFAASKDNSDYENIPPEAVIVTDFNSDIFKSSAFSNYDNEHQQYRLSKYDIINVSIVGFNDSLNKSNTMGRYGYTSSAINGSVNYNSTLAQTGFNDIVIGPDGYAQLPYAGSVKLAGLTVDEAKDLLTMKLGRYLKIPSMSVIVTSYGPRKVQVLGEVEKPGIIELAADDMNVLAAVTSAGWANKYGRIKKIQVIRIIDGVMYVKEANLKDYIEKHDIRQNIELKDGDILYIPRSNKIDLQDDIMPWISFYGLYKNITD